MFELLFALFSAVLGTVLSYWFRGPTLPSWSLEYSIAVAVTRCLLDLNRGHTVPRMRKLERFHDRMAGTAEAAALDGVAFAGVEWTIDTRNLLQYERATQAMFPDGFQGYFVPEEVEYEVEVQEPVKARIDALQYHLKAEFCTPTDSEDIESKSGKRKCIILVHGGAFALCTAPMYRSVAARLARTSDADVLTVEYRKPPERPFPAAIHDIFAAYLYLIDRKNPAFHAVAVSRGAGPDLPIYEPEDVVFLGDSAGANLALAAAVYLKLFVLNHFQQPVFPLPGGLVFHSGWFDLTYSNSSWDANGWIDTIPRTIINSVLDYMYDGILNCSWAYVNGYDPVPRKTRNAVAGTQTAGGERTASLDRGIDGTMPTASLKRRERLARTSSFNLSMPRSQPSNTPIVTQPHRLKSELALLSLILHPLISSVRTADFSGFPPVLIQSAAFENMLDDSILLAEKYGADCGDKGKGWVRHELYDEAVHDFMMAEGFVQSQRAMESIGRWVKGLDSLRAGKKGPGGTVKVGIATGGEVRAWEGKYVDRLHEFVARLCLVNRQGRQ